MNDAALRTYILADDDLAALAATGADASIAAALNAVSGTRIVSRFINERTLLDAFQDPADGEAVLQALEALVATDPAGLSEAMQGLQLMVTRAMRWMLPSEAGVDIGSPQVRALLDALVTATVLNQTQATAVKALADVPSSVAYAEFGEPVTTDDVSRALLPDRPNGQIASNE